jgi:hypothetical protein
MLAAFARSGLLEGGVVAFDVFELDHAKWCEQEDWLGPSDLDRVAVKVPRQLEDEDHMLAFCRLEVRHALERDHLDLAHMARTVESVNRRNLLEALERHLSEVSTPAAVA